MPESSEKSPAKADLVLTREQLAEITATLKFVKGKLYAGEVELAQTVLTHLLWDLALL